MLAKPALQTPPRPPEKAIALEPVTLMAWTRTELYNIIQSRPQFGAALSQMLVQRLICCQARVESFAVDRVNQRLARTLIRLASRMSESSEDGYELLSRI